MPSSQGWSAVFLCSYTKPDISSVEQYSTTPPTPSYVSPPQGGKTCRLPPPASGGGSSGDFHDIGAPLTEVCSDGIEIEVEAITGEDGQAARSAVKPDMVKLWPLAGAAIMLTSMKAATIAPRRCAARERRREARRVQRIVGWRSFFSISRTSACAPRFCRFGHQR